MGARFYWPELGRFIQQDPIGDDNNWYAYAANNPLVYIDPTGESLGDLLRRVKERLQCGGYLDLSGSFLVPLWRLPVGVGPVFGMQFGYDPEAARKPWHPLHASTWDWAHPYAGAGIGGPPRLGGSAMWGAGSPRGPGRPTRGFYVAASGGSRSGLSVGLGPPGYDDPWVEWGYTTPGLIIQGYYLW